MVTQRLGDELGQSKSEAVLPLGSFTLPKRDRNITMHHSA